MRSSVDLPEPDLPEQPHNLAFDEAQRQIHMIEHFELTSRRPTLERTWVIALEFEKKFAFA